MPTHPPVREKILSVASMLISGDRHDDYGPPDESFQRIADEWTLELRDKLKPGESVDNLNVVRMFIRSKMVRSNSSPDKLDHWVDIAGYSGLGGELAVNNDMETPND